MSVVARSCCPLTTRKVMIVAFAVLPMLVPPSRGQELQGPAAGEEKIWARSFTCGRQTHRLIPAIVDIAMKKLGSACCYMYCAPHFPRHLLLLLLAAAQRVWPATEAATAHQQNFCSIVVEGPNLSCTYSRCATHRQEGWIISASTGEQQ